MKTKNWILGMSALLATLSGSAMASAGGTQQSDPCRAAGIRKIMAEARQDLTGVEFVDAYYNDEDGPSGPMVDVEVKGTSRSGKSCEYFYTVDMSGTPGQMCSAGQVQSGGCD